MSCVPGRLIRSGLIPLVHSVLGRHRTKRHHVPVFTHRNSTFRGVVRHVELMTTASVDIVVFNRGNANGRRVTRLLRSGDGHTNGPFITISYNSLSGRLTPSTFFKRIGNTFANTSGTGGKCFRRTRNNALFLSRMKGLTLRARRVLLHTVRREQCHPIKSGTSQGFGIHVVTTAGRSLRMSIGRGHFQRSLLCHLRSFKVAIPPLHSYRRSVVPLTRFFHSVTGERLRYDIDKFDSRTHGTLLART